MFGIVKNLLFIEGLLVVGILLARYIFGGQARNIVSAKLIAITLFTPVVGLFGGNAYVLYAYLAAVVAFSARSRAELAGTYLAILPSVPALIVETNVAGVYIGALSTIVAMNFGALVGALITRAGIRGDRGVYAVGVSAMVVIFVYIYGREGSATALLRGATVFVIGFVGPYLLLSGGVRSRADVDLLAGRLLYGAILTAIVGVFQSSRRWVIYEVMYQTLHVELPSLSAATSLRGGLLRTGGTMLDYSAAGEFLAAAVCVLPFATRSMTPPRRWLLAGILFAGLLVTQSRGAWVGAIVGFLFVLLYRGRFGIAAGVAVVLGAAESVILTVAKSGPLGSILGATDDAAGTITYRRQLASRGFEQVVAHPVFGQTPNRLIDNLQDLVQGQHIVDFVNVHLFIAMTAGVPLFGVWIMVWMLPVVRAWRLRRLRPDDRAPAEMPAAIMVSSMTSILATSLIDRNMVWPTIALGLAAPCFAVARLPRRGVVAAPPAKLVWGLPSAAEERRPLAEPALAHG